MPVTFVAGFLGSGKTTLVNRILAEPHGLSFAVVVNEFGEVGIDGRLVVGADEDVVELRNGCICCTVRTDLSETLSMLLARRRRRLFGRARFDRILIEASGLASPGPAVQTLRIDPALSEELELDGIVALAHAGHFVRQLAEHPEAGEQIGYADLVLLNHADTAGAAALAEAEAAVRACNAVAAVRRTTRADAEVRELIELRAGARERPAPGATTQHTCGIGTVALASDAPLDLHKLKIWLQFLAGRRGQEILRMKGILRCANHEPPVVVQAVYQWLELGPGAGAAPATSHLVVIGRELDRAELERGWAACRG